VSGPAGTASAKPPSLLSPLPAARASICAAPPRVRPRTRAAAMAVLSLRLIILRAVESTLYASRFNKYN
jgi:hypothetical protein